MQRALGILVFLCTITVSTGAFAQQVTVPFDVGVGPTANMMFGPVFRDKPIHTGLRFSTAAIIDQATLKKHKNRIPKQYRRAVLESGEVRYNPLSCCIPSTVYISPPIPGTMFADTGIYGLTMKPIGLGFNLLGHDRYANLFIGVGALLTYFYMHSKTLPTPMHFLRPGIEGRVELEIVFSKETAVSLGWASMAHIPQEVGGSILKIGDLQNSVWHIGQAFFQIHIRKPVTVRL